MNRPLTIIAAGFAVAAAGLLAQQQQQQERVGTWSVGSFQQIGTLDMNQWMVTAPVVVFGRVDTIAGSPFSATEERKTVQTLGDGTQIERAESDHIYRDSQGRTRAESMTGGKQRVLIVDPVAGFRIQLIPAEKTATRTAMPAGGRRGGRGGANVPESVRSSQEYQYGRAYQAMIDRGESAVPDSRPKEEDLGIQNQNGVAAHGTRSTLTIPAGQIGNNRDIHVVNERWYSNDLQMMVKTVNSDPRFGVTTYQLTNLSRSNPDPSLFQVPADYTMREGGERGARGGAGR